MKTIFLTKVKGKSLFLSLIRLLQSRSKIVPEQTKFNILIEKLKIHSPAEWRMKFLMFSLLITAGSFLQLNAQTYTFTNAGATGQNGPSQSDVNTEYTNTNLAGKVTVNGGIQYWVVPSTGLYHIDARGAQGYGTYGGRGARMVGDFLLTGGDTLKILVGQKAPPPVGSNNQFAGGGGTFITYPDNTPLLVAGGGGGSWATSFTSTTDASTSTSGNSGANAVNNGTGGTGGGGGQGSGSADGGGGLTGDGTGGGGGFAFINGGLGGKATSTGHGEGGFGGGGGTSSWDNYRCGGGGGYSGGGGAGQTSQAGNPEGGGGGSYNAGINQNNVAGVQTGDGIVTIEVLTSGAHNDAGVIGIDSPSVFCSGVNDVIVTVQNFGQNILDSVTVNWSVDGIAQTSVKYIGTIDTIGGTGAATKKINLGPYSFGSAAYTIVAWASEPNGVTDTVSANDSTTAIKQAGLPTPTNLATGNILGNQAQISWTGGSTTNTWSYIAVPKGLPPIGIIHSTSTQSALVVGLTSETTYDFYVREVCPSGGYSAWAGPLTFSTPFLCPSNGLCFNTCGQIGNTGPSQSQCDTEYSGTNLANEVTLSSGIQQWEVPVTGLYHITAFGAQGSNASDSTGGLGAKMSGEFFLNEGQVLHILVGQNAPNTPARVNLSSSGGGGTFITRTPHNHDTAILVIAGGGGGTGNEMPATANATTSSSGQTGSHGSGGTNGGAGTSGIATAGAGGGFLTDGSGTAGGKAYVNGGEGGIINTTYSINGGGFGGGGSITAGGNSRYGGGGGYSGGSGSNSQSGATTGLWGGGGGSFNNGTNQQNASGVRKGGGLAVIVPLSSGVALDAGAVSIDAPTAFCPGSNNVMATIRNYGKTKLDSVRVYWSVDGVAQTPQYFSGSVDTAGGSGSATAQVNLGSYNFTSSLHEIKVWTVMPNGSADTSNKNDTVIVYKQANLPPPVNLRAGTLNATNAVIKWDGGSSSNSWLYNNVATGVTPTGPGTAVQVDSVQVTGLFAITSYDFYVREVCTSGDTSAWAGPFTYQTPCAGPLSGTYTVNPGLPVSTTNFKSLENALDALDRCGVSGPVTFNVAANSGPYTGGAAISTITGSSATNTVTFNGNGNVINEGVANYFVALDGVSHLTINNFKFINTDPAAPIYGIMLRGGSEHVNITNNLIDVGKDVTGTAGGGIIVSDETSAATTAGDNAQYVTITGNEIVGGYYGITLIGNTSYADNYGHVVSNNIIRDYYVYGVYMVNADTVVVEGNDFNRNNRTAFTTFYGMYMSSCRNTKIRKNEIHHSGTASYTAYPIYLTTSVNSSGFETEIVNNSIHNIDNMGTTYGINFQGTRDYVNVYHNTIDLSTNGLTGNKRSIHFTGAPNNHNIKNNILSISGDGSGIKYCMYVTTTSTSFTSDNNVLYNGSTAGTNYTGYWTASRSSFGDWQSASSQDANSVDDNPQFANSALGNLKPLTIDVDNLGTPVGVSTDISGASRSNTTPDAGAIEFTGLTGDLAMVSAEVQRVNICYNTSDTAEFVFRNLFGTTVNFSTNPTSIVWSVTGPVNSSDTVVVNSDTLAVDSTFSVKAYSVDLSVPGMYYLTAYLLPNSANPSTANDTLLAPFEYEVTPILSVDPKTTTLTAYGDSVELLARSPLLPSGGFFITEICHYRGSTNGAPAGGWPSYLVADDYIEITGVPNSDLAGLTLEQWDASSMVSTHTFPSGTTLGPNGTAVIAVGQLGSSTASPSDYYYHGNGSYTGTFGSTTTAGRILKDGNGNIIDAVVYGNYTFPTAANVTATDWTGTTPSVSSAGNKLMGAYTKDATNWVNSGTAGGSPLQDPNTVNTGVTVPQAGTISGLTWTHNSVTVDTIPSIIAGPYTTHGTYTYIAIYNSACGTYKDTATVIVPPIIDMAAAGIAFPTSITCGSNFPLEVVINNVATEDIDFTIDPVTVKVEITGQTTQTISLLLDDNSLNSNLPLAKGTGLTVNLGNINLSASGTYYFVASVAVVGDTTPGNDAAAMDSVVINSIADAGLDLQVCSGSPSPIGGSPVAIGGTAPYTYTWAPSNVLSNAAVANPNATVNSNTVFTVTVTDSFGCVSKDSMLVEALSSPSPQVSGDSVVCTGTFTYSTPFNAGTTYQWSVGNGTIIGSDSSETVEVLWNQAGTGSVYVKQTITAGGCFKTTPIYWVNIKPSPSISFTATGSTTFCQGGNVNLLAIPQTGYTYEWLKDGSVISGITTNIYNANTAGDYKVVVTNSSGCTDSSSAITVTVNQLPAATISPAGATTFCDGGSVVLNANTGSGLTYQWMMNSGAISGAIFAAHTASQQGNFTVKVTDANGCSATSAQQTVTVNAMPVASIIAMGPTTICQGQNVILAAIPVTGASYQWKLDGTNISGATSTTYTATADGDYTLEVTSAANCTEESNTISVTVNPLPSATITPAGSTTFCDGGSVVLDANTGTGLTYKWMLNGTTITGANSAFYTASQQGNYVVEVTNANGCTAQSAQEPVTVNPMPTASASAAGSTTVCQGENVFLSAMSVSGATYQWKLNGSDISGATTANYTATSTGSYTVEVTSAANCAAVSNAIAVTVNPLPNNSVTASGPTSFCDGGSVDLVSGAASGVTYQWMSGGLPISGATSGTYTANQSGVYTLSVTSAQGCEAVSSPITVTVNPNPVAVIIFTGATSICQGENTLMVGLSQPGYSYQWQRDGNDVLGATSNTYTADQSGAYTMEVTSSAGCETVSTAVNVTVNPLPQAIITPAGPTTVCEGTDVVLDANTGTGLTYKWYHNGNLITNATSASYTATMSGNYTVSVTNASNCMATSSITGVTVNSNPTASITVQGSNDICEGENVMLEAATVSNGSYQWKRDGVVIGGANSISHNAMLAGDYTVLVTDVVTGCMTESGAEQIVVNPMPVVLFEAENVCLGEEMSFDNLSTVSSGNMTYSWDFEDNNSSTDENPTHTYGQAGVYNVSLTATSSDGIFCSATKKMDVEVYAVPESGFTYGYMGHNRVRFTPDDTSGNTYMWDFGNDSTSSEMNVEHVYATGGTYDVSLVVTNEFCTSETQMSINFDPTSVVSIQGDNFNFGVYPNPFTDKTYITYDLTSNANVKIEVYDVLGRVVMSFDESKREAGSYSENFNATEFAPQTFVVRLTVDNQVYNRKIILVH